MPRKQRFKPSRKPQSQQAVVSNQHADEGKEIKSDEDVRHESSMAEEPAPREIEKE
jgi:hypothetical protein